MGGHFSLVIKGPPEDTISNHSDPSTKQVLGLKAFKLQVLRGFGGEKGSKTEGFGSFGACPCL